MPIGTPKYITAAQVISLTQIETLKASDQATIDPFILSAEDKIDTWFGIRKHHPDDTDTYRVFPRILDEDDDGLPIIPDSVLMATLRTVEWLWLQGVPTTSADLEGGIKKETVNASGYSYEKGDKPQGKADLLPNEAIQIMTNFKNSQPTVKYTPE